MISFLKRKLYSLITGRNKNVLDEFEEYKKINRDYFRTHKLKSFLYLRKLKKYEKKKTQNIDAIKPAVPMYAKNSLKSFKRFLNDKPSRQNSAKVIKLLQKYDVISFDIFDTLVFRYLNRPIHVFSILGNERGLSDFTNVRRLAERRSRDIKFKTDNTYEVDIFDVYNTLNGENNFFLNAEDEIELEFLMCFKNPYMHSILNAVKKTGKKIVVCSDMYFKKDLMKRLLSNCGYDDFDEIFVSCDYKCGKCDLKLFEMLKEKFPGKKIIHIGDNLVDDIKNGRKAGIDTYYYKNVNNYGSPYYLKVENELLDSVIRGIVNSKFYSGDKEYSADYKFGFLYMGSVIAGIFKILECIVNKTKKNIVIKNENLNSMFKTYLKDSDTKNSVVLNVCVGERSQVVFESGILSIGKKELDFLTGFDNKFDFFASLKNNEIEYGIKDFLNIYFDKFGKYDFLNSALIKCLGFDKILQENEIKI